MKPSRALHASLAFAALMLLSSCGSSTSSNGDTNSGSSVSAPAFSVAGGTYSSTQTVTLTSTTAGAVIFYTLDGSTPTVYSTPYFGALTVSSSETVKAIAVSTTAGTTGAPLTSSVASATYTISTGGVGDASHDAALLGTWKSIEVVPDDGSGYSSIDTTFSTFKSTGSLTDITHSRVTPPTGPAYVSIDTTFEVWSTSGNQLSITAPDGAGTGTYSTIGTTLTVVWSSGFTTSFNKL